MPLTEQLRDVRKRLVRCLLAIALAACHPGARVIAIDDDPGALRYARRNVRCNAAAAETVQVLELDVNAPDDLTRLADDLAERWEHLDGVLHAIAQPRG